MPVVRAKPGVHAEVRRVPNLFPRAGVGGASAGRDEVKLVGATNRVISSAAGNRGGTRDAAITDGIPPLSE